MRYAGVGFAFLVLLAGCGGGTSHESVLREQIGAMDEIATVLENSKTADEAKPKLEKAASRLKDIKKRADALPKPSDTEKANLEKKLKPEMEKTVQRFIGAMMQFSQRDPTGMEKLEPIFKDLDVAPK
jgi:hypothetical protein